MKRPAAFLDRDGTLNVDTNYTHRVDDLYLIPGAARAVRAFNAAGFRVVIVTNQSGIARGLFSEADMHTFNTALLARLGGQVDLVQFCPHHPAFSAPCACRKPGTGMIEAAASVLDIDLTNSLMIGDRATDVQTAVNAGFDGYLFDGGDLHDFCHTRNLFAPDRQKRRAGPGG